MPTIEAMIEIAQPPEVIAEALLDPKNAVHWTSDLERFEVVSRTPGEVGSVAHLHYVQGGRRYVMEDCLEEMIPNEYFRSTVSGGGLKAQVETWLRSKNGSTEVTVRWAGTGTSLPVKILLPFMRRSIRRQTLKDLNALKSLIETHGAHFEQAQGTGE